jgi:methionyl-tRNA synthetase
MKKYFVTSALPYANGDLHLGHLVEYIQTDIWVRFNRLIGNEVVYICADDAHGTPIMLKAESEKISPEELIKKTLDRHKNDFDCFFIKFDNFYTTHSKENEQLSTSIYMKLVNENLIEKKTIHQFFDDEKLMFLPDRYIIGSCPKCKSNDQYGDSCDKCGATYSPTDLLNPESVLSGKTPIKKKTDHFFFKLSDKKCTKFLNKWIYEDNRLQEEARNKIKEWLSTDINNSSLIDWDISRDAPYFGFKIPDQKDKYFYVWLDAPIGYYASLMNWCSLSGKKFDDFVSLDSEYEQVHFIGKDILYFHALFWPAILHFAGYRTPTSIFAHGFLTVNGKKMSKSKGTFITAQQFLKCDINPDYLRYYFACKLNGSMEDIDLNISEFCQKVNSDLVGKFINIQSRCSKFLLEHFEGRVLPKETIMEINSQGLAIESTIKAKSDEIKALYLTRNTAQAIRDIMLLVDQVNQYFQEKKPWEMIKSSGVATAAGKNYLHSVLSVAIRSFGALTILLKPVIPDTCKKIERDVFCDLKPLTWNDLESIQIKKIKKADHLLVRIKHENVSALMGE